MKVENNGSHLTITADYYESAIIVEAIRKGILQYELDKAHEYVKLVEIVLDNLVNRQIIV